MSTTENKLLALVFDDPYKADEARAALHRMEGEGLVELHETAVIARKSDGKTRVSQDFNEVEKDQHIGHIAGLITAAATGMLPFILGGTLAGKLIGRLRDDGITNKFLKSLQNELHPNTSILVIYGKSDEQRRLQVPQRLANFNPKLLESDMSPEVENAVREEMQAAQSAAAAASAKTSSN